MIFILELNQGDIVNTASQIKITAAMNARGISNRNEISLDANWVKRSMANVNYRIAFDQAMRYKDYLDSGEIE